LEGFVRCMAGNQIFLAPVTVSELRDDALVARWAVMRRELLEQAIGRTTVGIDTGTAQGRDSNLKIEVRPGQAGHLEHTPSPHEQQCDGRPEPTVGCSPNQSPSFRRPTDHLLGFVAWIGRVTE
jgi:hypothetical protein